MDSVSRHCGDVAEGTLIQINSRLCGICCRRTKSKASPSRRAAPQRVPQDRLAETDSPGSRTQSVSFESGIRFPRPVAACIGHLRRKTLSAPSAWRTFLLPQCRIQACSQCRPGRHEVRVGGWEWCPPGIRDRRRKLQVSSDIILAKNGAHSRMEVKSREVSKLRTELAELHRRLERSG